MISFIKTLMSTYWASILKWGSIAVGAISLYLSIRKSGGDAVRVEQMEDALDATKESDKIRREVRNNPDVDGRVSKFYLD